MSIIKTVITMLSLALLPGMLTAAECDKQSVRERFDINDNGTVTDIESGLTWMRCALGQQWDGKTCVGTAIELDWQNVNETITKLNKKGGYASRKDWRLPKLNELATLTILRCDPPRIDLTLFPNTLPDRFWTRNSTPAAPDYAYTLSFGREGVGHEEKSAKHYVRLVRGRNE
jgi:hypothetical protein